MLPGIGDRFRVIESIPGYGRRAESCTTGQQQ